MSGLRGRKIINVIDIAQGLLLHLDRVDYSLGYDSFLLLSLRLDV